MGAVTDAELRGGRHAHFSVKPIGARGRLARMTDELDAVGADGRKLRIAVGSKIHCGSG